MEAAMELSKHLPHAGTLTPVSFDVSPQLTREEWVKAGEILHASHDTHQWWIGDWFSHGVAHFDGDMRSLIDAPEWRGPAYATCRHLGSVASRLPVCRRRHTLNFSLHREVVKDDLTAAQQDALLDRAERERATVMQVREWVQEAQRQPHEVPSREQLIEQLTKVHGTSERSRKRVVTVVERDPVIAARVLRGEITLTRGDQLARESHASRRKDFAKATFAQAVAQAPARVTVVGEHPESMARQLMRAVRILAELSHTHVAIYLLRQRLDGAERSAMNDQLKDARLYLQRVEATFAAGLGDINTNDEKATA